MITEAHDRGQALLICVQSIPDITRSSIISFLCHMRLVRRHCCVVDARTIVCCEPMFLFCEILRFDGGLDFSLNGHADHFSSSLHQARPHIHGCKCLAKIASSTLAGPSRMLHVIHFTKQSMCRSCASLVIHRWRSFKQCMLAFRANVSSVSYTSSRFHVFPAPSHRLKSRNSRMGSISNFLCMASFALATVGVSAAGCPFLAGEEVRHTSVLREIG